MGILIGSILALFTFDMIYDLSLTDNYNNSWFSSNNSDSTDIKNTDTIAQKLKSYKSKFRKSNLIGVDSLNNSINDSLDADGNNYSRLDSLSGNENSAYSNNNSGDEIVVMKDELLFSTLLKPTGKPNSYFCDYNEKMDSLLIDNGSIKNANLLKVEFWRSPVNFKGYKLNKRSLILFGVYQFDNLKLEYGDDRTLTMNYKNQKVLLRCTENFLALKIKN